MQSSRHRYSRNSCNSHHSGGMFFVFPLIFLSIFVFRAISFWPFLIVLTIIFFASKPNSKRSRYYPTHNSSYLENNNSENVSKSQFNADFCPNCGSSLESDALFCSECGNKLI